MTTLYNIIRFYHPSLNKESEIVEIGLTLKEAQEHCNDPDTREDGVYFDGYMGE
jgi:hypothetical protein